MNILKNAYLLTAGQRKILVIIVLAFALMNSHVSTARATDPETLINPFVLAQTISADSLAVSTVTEPEIVTASATKPTVQDILLEVCETKGYGEDCAKTLLGMLWNESSNRYNVVGDGGRARGYFQIHYRLHNITADCAEDLVCSATWSLNYLERNGYPRYVSYAVQCHNSCGVNNGYAAKALRNGKYFWNKPLEVKQAAPIELAMK